MEMLTCDNCGEEYDPIRTRWLCPNCHYKAHCCEGEPANVTLPTLDEILAHGCIVRVKGEPQ